jgi:drug/metabolite transporter (DMT)-like permease
MGWIIATLLAAAAQTARNAAQAGLVKQIGMLGATQVRFLYGFPFACLFLLAVSLWQDRAPVWPAGGTLIFVAGGALSQITATALMLRAMQGAGFGVTTAWIKTEPVLVALFGVLLLGDHLAPLAWAGVAVATCGVVLTGVKPGQIGALIHAPGPILTGLAAAGFFGLSAVLFRRAILSLPDGDFLFRATHVLVWSLGLQATIMLAVMALIDRPGLAGSFRLWRSSLTAGALGATASQFWFIGFALTSAANVRTLALVEVIMAMAVGWLRFRQPVTALQALGVALIALGVGLLLRTAL